jgi:hypothetical protein
LLIMTGGGAVMRGKLRPIVPSFVAPGPSGVAVRGRLKDLTPVDEKVLRAVGAHLGSLASRDLAQRCRDGLGYSAEAWAARKRELTGQCSSRWAGAITKATRNGQAEPNVMVTRWNPSDRSMPSSIV